MPEILPEFGAAAKGSAQSASNPNPRPNTRINLRFTNTSLPLRARRIGSGLHGEFRNRCDRLFREIISNRHF